MTALSLELEEAVPFAGVPPLGPYRLSDYLALPDEPRLELLQGRLFMAPAPNLYHQAVSILLSKLLQAAASAGRGFALAAPTDVVLCDETVVQPDLLYLRAGRRPTSNLRVDIVPDLLIEVISKQHARRDRTTKLALYAQAGVAEYWIVDPEAQCIDFFVLVDGSYQAQVVVGPVYTSAHCPEIAIDPKAFWAEVDHYVSG